MLLVSLLLLLLRSQRLLRSARSPVLARTGLSRSTQRRIARDRDLRVRHRSRHHQGLAGHGLGQRVIRRHCLRAFTRKASAG